MKTRSLLLAATLPLLALAGAAQAQTYCTAGSLNACASVVVEKNGNTVWIRVRNLQGQVAGDNTWYSGLLSLDVYMPGVTGFSNFQMQTDGSVGTIGTTPPWAATYFGNLNMVRVWGTNQTAGIAGCNDGAGAPLKLASYQTCAQDGWVVFSFDTFGAWDPSTAWLRWSGNAYLGPTASKQVFFCDPRQIGADCGYVTNYVAPPPGNVTPEPVTLALLGTGLAGVGAAARRRRRRPDEDAG